MAEITSYLPAICAGFGLFLAGVANLVLLRKPFAMRAMATLLAIGGALGASTLLERSETVIATARLLGMILIPFFLLSSRRARACMAAVATATTLPAVRFGLLTVAGIGTALGAVAIYERADESATNNAMQEMELFHAAVPSAPTEKVVAKTDRGTKLDLRESIAARDSQLLSELEVRYLRSSQLESTVMRHGEPDDRSNCHGWVFTGGRFLVSGTDVEVILKENNYRKLTAPQSGDLVIYRSSGMVIHTAVVQYVADGQPVLVRGKWGNLGIFMHEAGKSPYGTEFTYYRSKRDGHLLAGAGGPIEAISSGSTPATSVE